MKNILHNLTNQKNPLKLDLFTGTLTALLFSAFIYLEYFGFTIELLNTLFGLSALFLLLRISKRAVLVSGFLIGLLWFYWIGYSFEYQGVGYMTPIITFAFAIIYMLFFGVTAFTNKVYVRAILLFGLSFFEPFDFNWLQMELLFIDSYLGVQKYQLIIILIALSLPEYIKRTARYASLALLILAINFNPPEPKFAPLKIKLVSTDIKQEVKWKKESLKPTIAMIYKEINVAIANKQDVIILPESVFPMFLNRSPLIIESLKELSRKISVVAGSLLSQNGANYNVTYIFSEGEMKIAKKMVLVPFGEYMPVPK
ncbi:MAG: apolipoprotein N-acyltransferase, partial [Deltaproteobacteria bacterium]